VPSTHLHNHRECVNSNLVGRMQGLDRVIAKIIMSSVLWFPWKTRNGACFDKIILVDSCDIIFMICHFNDY
jgi:hypothetical protein